MGVWSLDLFFLSIAMLSPAFFPYHVQCLQKASREHLTSETLGWRNSQVARV